MNETSLRKTNTVFSFIYIDTSNQDGLYDMEVDMKLCVRRGEGEKEKSREAFKACA